jgi:hypothetical protein
MTARHERPWWLQSLAAGTAPPRRVVTTERSLSVRLLRLKTLRPSGWQRVLLWEGTFFAALIAALADVAPAWLMLVVPLLVAAMVKLNDIVVTRLDRTDRR